MKKVQPRSLPLTGKVLIVVLLLLTHYSSTAQDYSAAAISALYQQQQNNPLVKYINKLDQTVRKKNALTGLLTAQDLTRLPIGIVDPTGTVVICIDSAQFSPAGATFNAYAAISIPGQKTKLCLRAASIPFGPGGITASGPGIALSLVSTHVLPGGKVDLVLPGNGNTNIRFDCNGFKEANFEGQAVFKNYLFVPDPVEAPGATTVTATLKLEHIVNLGNMIASLSITPFKLKGMEDFAFKVNGATLDMSDYNNPEGSIFPVIYSQEYGSNMNLWRGFYLRNITVRTPFNKGGGYAKVMADHLLIDEHGFSGRISGQNIIDINEGSMSGWSFSLDSINVELLRSKLTGGTLGGGMRVPFLGSDSLGYRATISQWNDELEYSFGLGLREDKIFNSPVGNAKVRIKAGSYVELGKYQGRFVAMACLHGNISKQDGVARFNNLRFENVRVSTRAPYIHSGTFALDGDVGASLGGFGIGLSSVGFGVDSGRAVLSCTAALGLSDEADRGFGIAAAFRFKANIIKEEQPTERQSWQFAGVQVDSAAVLAQTGAFDLEGIVRFYENDATYGNGFKGELKLTLLKSSLNIQATGSCYFGTNNGLKYWQVSAYLSADSWGVPVVPSVIYMNGFMGGVTYHMRRNSAFFTTPSMMDTVTYQPVTSPDQWARQTYTPDAGSGIGIMVGTSLYAVNKNLLSASVALEIGLNNNGGLNYVQFNGYATLFKNINTIAPATIVKGQYASDAAFTATVNILYDRPGKTFHANVSAYMNLGVIRGAGAGNQLGELVIHADPSQWYVYVGRPSSPVAAKLSLGNTDLVTVQSYFMFGKLLDPFPAPPAEVTSVINYTPPVSVAALQNGSGVAFGARFRAGAGFDWGWLYAGIWLGAGGDIMVSTSGNATCDGQPVGFGGWWARGQVYAWLQGGVGIRVRVMGQRREFKILELAAAVLLEAKVPKPSWFRGHVGVRWSLLGGLIKGSINMSVKVGKECAVMTGTGISGDGAIARDLVTKVLSGTSPSAAQTGVNVYAAPAIATNIPVDSIFSQLDDQGNEQWYKVSLQTIKVYKGNGTDTVAGKVFYAPDKKLAMFQPAKRLLPETMYRVRASLAFMKRIGSGYWSSAVNEDGNPAYEDTSFSFTTAPPSDILTMADLEYAYPLVDQKNFYKAEYAPGGGYIQAGGHVNFDQVFYPGNPGNGGSSPSYSYKIKLKSITPGDSYTTHYQPIVRSGQRISFNLPGIENGKVYRLSIVRIAGSGNAGNGGTSTGGMAGGITGGQTVSSQGFGSDSTAAYADTTVRNVINGEVSQTETEVLGYYFRVSKYNSFTEKMNTMQVVSENQQDIAEGGVVLVATKNNMSGELFDEFELSEAFNTQGSYEDDNLQLVQRQLGGGTGTNRLIRIVADSTSAWLQQDIYPLVYPNDISSTIGEPYYRGTVAGGGGSSSSINGYSGIAPLSKVTAEQYPRPGLPNTTDAYERMSITATQLGQTKLLLKYNLPFFANRDFMALYTRALGYWVSAPLADKTVTFSKMVATGGIFPQIRTGSYLLRFSYYLPGSATPSTVKTLPVVY